MAEDNGNVRAIGDVFLKLGFKFDEKSFNEAMEQANNAGKAYKEAESVKSQAEAAASSNNEKEEEAAQGKKGGNDGLIKATQAIGGSLDKLSSGMMSIIKGIFGIIKNVAGKLEEASPILQAVHQLFNLAMTLFFMPIGNKLGEVMIPAVLKMIDKALEFWDELEDEGLTGMIEKAMVFLCDMLGQYFIDLADQIEKNLSGKDNILGTIATVLRTIGSLIKNMPTLLQKGVEIMKWVLDNLGSLIGIVVAFKAASLAMQAIQVIATLASSAGVWGAVLGGVGLTAVLAGAGGMIGAGVAGSLLSSTSTSVDTESATSGLNTSSSVTSTQNNNYNITYNGMTETDLNKTIYKVSGGTSSYSQLQT